MKRFFQHFFCGLLSFALFFILFFIADLSVILSGLSGVVLFFICSSFLTSGNESSEQEINSPSDSNVESALSYGFQKLEAIEKKSFGIENESVRTKVGRIYNLGRKILDDIKENPDDFYAARQFFNYYLDATHSILEKYVSLQENRQFLEIADESFRKTEALLDTVEVAYQKQLEKLFEDDVMNLDTELKVLAKTIKTEGF
ncbi:5-bromo-4-chloroindolyl phosphate hydrolysis family protein [Marinilabilia sp.]